jgi:hypothetical protein
MRLIIVPWLIVTGTANLSYSAEVIHADLATEQMSLNKKLTQAFYYSINLRKYTHAWIIYKLDKGIAPNKKISPIYDFSDTFPRLCDLLVQTTFPAAQQAKNLPFRKTDCFIVMKFFLQSGRPRILQIQAISPDDYLETGTLPIFWLGTVSSKHSFDFIKKLFTRENHDQLRQQMVIALGSHALTSRYLDFAKNILKKNYSNSVKKAVVSELKNYSDVRSIRLLTLVATKFKPEILRKIAIQSLAQNNHPLAFRLLQRFSLHSKDFIIRKESIFWLAQIGNKEAAQTLLKIIQTCNDKKIQEYTIFAISQLPDDLGKSILQQIAFENPDAELRETAVYWMGQFREDKKLDLLIDIFNTLEN